MLNEDIQNTIFINYKQFKTKTYVVEQTAHDHLIFLQ